MVFDGSSCFCCFKFGLVFLGGNLEVGSTLCIRFCFVKDYNIRQLFFGVVTNEVVCFAVLTFRLS